MSVAIKCDRCGKFFEAPKYGEKKRIRLRYQDINDVVEGNDYDLCPECDDEFKKWISEE